MNSVICYSEPGRKIPFKKPVTVNDTSGKEMSIKVNVRL